MSINAKISQLNEKIQWFYSDDFSLDSAAENYKSALALEKEIEADLHKLKNEVEAVRAGR